MQLAKVVGTVVSSHKAKALQGKKFLLLEKMNAGTGELTNDFIIAIDSVEAGVSDVVFYVTGSSARMTENTEGRPSDATIVAIVESIDRDNQYVYRRYESP